MFWDDWFGNGNAQVPPNVMNGMNMGGVDPYGNPMPMTGMTPGSHRVSKKEIVNYITANLGATEVVQVDDFETMRTRHICPNIQEINLLNPDIFVVNLPDGSQLNVGVIFCPRCKKLWINKSTLDYF